MVSGNYNVFIMGVSTLALLNTATQPVSAFQWSGELAGATVICFFVSILSVAGGVGGGGIFVPVFILMLNMSTHTAVPLSKAMIFAGAIVPLFFHYGKRRRSQNFDVQTQLNLVVLLQPSTLSGTLIGVLLNVILPSWLILSFLVLMLSFMSWRAFQNAHRLIRLEKDLKKKRLEHDAAASTADPSSIQDEPHPSITDAATPVPTDSITADTTLPPPPSPPLVLSFNDRCARFLFTTMWPKIVLLATLWIILILFAVLKSPYVVSGCSAPFWIFVCAPIVINALVTVWISMAIYKFYKPVVEPKKETQKEMTTDTPKETTAPLLPLLPEDKNDKNDNNDRNDSSPVIAPETPSSPPFSSPKMTLRWTPVTSVLYPAGSLLAGLLAGMLGIGGGMVIGPLLFELAQHPDPIVITGITSLMVLFTSSSTTTQYAILNLLPWKYALWFGAFSLVASVIGSVLIEVYIARQAVQHPQRKAYLVFALASVIGASGVLALVELILQAIDIAQGSIPLFPNNTAALCG